jgi:hypothetical protein
MADFINSGGYQYYIEASAQDPQRELGWARNCFANSRVRAVLCLVKAPRRKLRGMPLPACSKQG